MHEVLVNWVISHTSCALEKTVDIAGAGLGHVHMSMRHSDFVPFPFFSVFFFLFSFFLIFCFPLKLAKLQRIHSMKYMPLCFVHLKICSFFFENYQSTQKKTKGKRD